jgi:hypothetical protein
MIEITKTISVEGEIWIIECDCGWNCFSPKEPTNCIQCPNCGTKSCEG